MTDQYSDRVRPVGPRRFPPTDPPWYVAMVIGFLALILIVVIILLFRGDDDQIQTVGDTNSSASPTLPSTTADISATTTTTEPTTSSSAATTSSAAASSSTTAPSTATTILSTTSTASSTTTTVDPTVYEPAVWPLFEASTRYDDPVAAAKGFAEDFVGFDDPIVGQFQQGDNRSGEVEIRPTNDGPATVAIVRQLGPDDSWWVLGSATNNIVIQEPTALMEITDPLQVSGTALAFEGVVNLELRADGTDIPLVESSVTGGGTELEPFDGQFSWKNPGSGMGAVVLFTESMDDGRVWEASIVRVTFAAE